MAEKPQKPIFTRMPMANKMDWVVEKYDRPWIIYDTETTGLNKKNDRIVQLSAAKLERGGNGYVYTDALNLYIRQPVPISDEASAVNGITNEFLATQPTEKEVFEKVSDFFGDIRANVISGYNNQGFDDHLMNYMWERQAGVPFKPVYNLDFMKMAWELVYRKELPNDSYNLTDVGELYGIREDNMHSSDTDVSVTGKTAFAMLEDYRQNYKPGLLSQRYRPKGRVLRLWSFRKSKIVNYVYFTVADGNGDVSKFHYDIWNKRIVQDGTKDGRFITVDMLALADELDRRAGGDIAKFKEENNGN